MDESDLATIAWMRGLARSGALTAVRTAAGISLGEVAQVLGVNRATVTRWERGTHVPRPEAAMAYARLLRELGHLPEGRG